MFKIKSKGKGSEISEREPELGRPQVKSNEGRIKWRLNRILFEEEWSSVGHEKKKRKEEKKDGGQDKVINVVGERVEVVVTKKKRKKKEETV